MRPDGMPPLRTEEGGVYMDHAADPSEPQTVPADEYQRALGQVDAARVKIADLERELVAAKAVLSAVTSELPDSEFDANQNQWRRNARYALEKRGWVSPEELEDCVSASTRLLTESIQTLRAQLREREVAASNA